MKEWKAFWIWQPTTDPAQPNTYVYFRHVFDWTRRGEAWLRVSADTYYQLFLNGEWVGWGPPMTEPCWKQFDTYDVASRLRPGRNVIAAVVYHYGNGPENIAGYSFQPSRGGFLCQLNGSGDDVVVISDTHWKTLQSPAWLRQVPKIDRMTYMEVFDAGREPAGWLNADFDDSAWPHAERVTINPLVAQWNWNPSPSTVYPWIMLEERSIPYFERRRVETGRLLYAAEVLQRAEPGAWKHRGL